jgi:hypothetical protein
MQIDAEFYYNLSRSYNFFCKSEESNGHWIKTTFISAILLRPLLEHVPKLSLEALRKARKYAVSVARLRTSFEARNFQIRSMLFYSLDSDV